MNMTFTKSCHLFFLCFIVMPLLVFCDTVELHQGPNSHILLHEGININRSTILSVKAEQHAPSTSSKVLSPGSCTRRDISISQSQGTKSGIPQYIVEIANTCVSECAPRDIHLSCGWFASARLINPRVFKRLSYDDCLVNGGKPLESSQTIRFAYYNTFMYPLAFKSAKFC